MKEKIKKGLINLMSKTLAEWVSNLKCKKVEIIQKGFKEPLLNRKIALGIFGLSVKKPLFSWQVKKGNIWRIRLVV